MNAPRLTDLIETFISRRDVSISLASEIEAELDALFPDDDGMQDVVTMLASYRPGGGEHLYDEHDVTSRLKALLEMLTNSRAISANTVK